MKIILVRSGSERNARNQAFSVYEKIRDSTPIIADFLPSRCEVRTESVFVRFINGFKNIDGMRCDIPCGFSKKEGLILTGGKEYKELWDLKDIIKFIIDEEAAGQ